MSCDTRARWQTLMDGRIALTDWNGIVNCTQQGDNSFIKSGGTNGTLDAVAYSTTTFPGDRCTLICWVNQVSPSGTADPAFPNTYRHRIFIEALDGTNQFGFAYNNFVGVVPIYEYYKNGVTGPFISYATAGFFVVINGNGTAYIGYDNDPTFTNVTDIADRNPNNNAPTYVFTGLDTTKTYRVKRELGTLSPPVVSPTVFLGTETVAVSYNCLNGTCIDPGDGTGTYATLAACVASGCSSTPPTGITGINTVRFDEGEGNSWYLVPPLIDSGDELRSKVYKACRATGKLTNPTLQVYTYDVEDPIIVSDLEDGLNSQTGAIALPDTTNVTQSARQQVNTPNAVLGTIRLAGDDTGETTRDRIDEIVVEQAEQGVRR